MVYLFVGIAGALGALTRYLVGLIIFPSLPFPFATLTVNLVGCYILAYLTSVVFSKRILSSNTQTALTTGFLGSFTTFSAFSLDSLKLFQQGEIIFAILYVGISMVGGMIMSNLGWNKERSK